jgi:hypothetical protein
VRENVEGVELELKRNLLQVYAEHKIMPYHGIDKVIAQSVPPRATQMLYKPHCGESFDKTKMLRGYILPIIASSHFSGS